MEEYSNFKDKTDFEFMKEKISKMAEKAGKGQGKKIGHMIGFGNLK